MRSEEGEKQPAFRGSKPSTSHSPGSVVCAAGVAVCCLIAQGLPSVPAVPDGRDRFPVLLLRLKHRLEQ